MRRYIIRFFVVIIVLSNIQNLFAQGRVEIDSVMDLSPAYLPTSYSHLKSIEFEPLNFKPIETELIHTHYFDPLLKPENLYQHLGINGQAHQSLIFDYQKDMGFTYQKLPYPLFFQKQSDLKFYKLETTYSLIAYTFGLTKENEILAEFAKSFKGVTVSFNIYAIKNKGSFIRQDVSNLCGDLLIHYEIPSSIYGFKASYIINSLGNFENGGLKDVESYQSKNSDNIPVRFEKARSKITTHDFNLQNYVNIKDKNKRYFGTFTHDFLLSNQKIGYYDDEIILYPYFNAHNSDKTTNDTTQIFKIQNAIQWSNFEPYKENVEKNNFFRIAGGVLHDYANLKYQNIPFNSFYAFARTYIRLFKVMDINASINYSLYSDYNNNDLAAKAGISWSINREKEHFFGINANYFKNQSEYIMLYVFTNNFRWTNQFQDQNIFQLKAFWNYEKYNLSASYYYLNNLIYLSEELRPVQNTNDGNMIQVSAFVPFRYKNFGTTANLNVQYCTEEVVHIPLFAGKLSVFYIFEFFQKRLKIMIGTDVMYNTTYYADAYLPVLRMFYYQNSQSIGNFVFWDTNLTVKIDRISFFFRVSNLLPPIMLYRNFTTPDYPVKEYMFNLGINWRFFD